MRAQPEAGDGGEFLFREIGPDDFGQLAEFLVENDVQAVVRTFNPFPMTPETARRIATEPRLDHYYGGWMENRLVGLSMLRGWDEGFDVPSFGIMVDHRHQGKGIGGRMLDLTIDEAKRLGCGRIRLSVFASNLPGLHLYEARGFREASRVPVKVDGEADAKIVMFKELSTAGLAPR